MVIMGLCICQKRIACGRLAIGWNNMKLFRRGLLIAGLIASLQFARSECSAASVQATRIDALQVVIEAVQTTTPIPADQVPKFATFYSAQRGTKWPPLLCNSLNLPCWPIDDRHFVIDDRNVDYAAIQAEAEAEALLSAALNTPMSMMASSLLNNAVA